jgi:chromosome segregation ATPase
MGQAAKDMKFSQDQVRRQHEQLRSQIHTMEEGHQQFMGSLSDSQRRQMRNRIQKMDRARNRVNTHFQRMDQEISRPNLDRKHIAQQAGDMEKSMKEWQKQYQKVGSDLGVEP